jgi:hypothetical protein
MTVLKLNFPTNFHIKVQWKRVNSIIIEQKKKYNL